MMTQARSFRITAGILAAASLLVAGANIVTMLLAAHFDVQAMLDPLLLLHVGARASEIWRWSMVFDMFGYYLLIVPLILGLRSYLRSRSQEWTDLAAFCLLGYCVVGAMGTAVIASATPQLIAQYSAANAARRVLLEAMSSAYASAIYRGLLNLLEELLAGVGWMVLGALLHKERPALGWVTMLLGATCLLDFLGTLLQIDALAVSGLTLYLFMAPAWALWTGVLLLRSDASFVPAHAEIRT